MDHPILWKTLLTSSSCSSLSMSLDTSSACSSVTGTVVVGIHSSSALMGVMFLTNLSVRACLVLPEVRAVRWRRWVMLGLALVCGWLALAFLARHNAVYPSLHFPMLASAFLGGYAAYYFHQPRPALKR